MKNNNLFRSPSTQRKCGALPALYKEAGKNGRENKHLALTIFTAIIIPDPSSSSGFELFDYFTVFATFLLGLVLGNWMGQLEEQFK